MVQACSAAKSLLCTNRPDGAPARASLVVVSMWTGGLAALGFVAAPEIFATLEAAEPANGRVLAGQVFGAVFARFQH